MYRSIFFIFMLFLGFTINGNSQSGILLESEIIQSNFLDRPVEYSIYLPADYETSNRRFPVLYLLHGYTDDETGWTQFGEVKKIADQYQDDPEVTDMIIVMPDAGLDFYLNTYDRGILYEDFFISELIPFIDSMYMTRPTGEFRAIAGLSMGGHGTILYAAKHPELFAAAAPLSAAAWEEQEITDMPQKDWDGFMGKLFGPGTQGRDRITEHLRSNMPHYLMQDKPVEDLKKVRWYIDCGDDDFLINGNMRLHRIMTSRGIPHEFRVRDGAHNWTYWRTALPEVLKFASASFHRR